MGGCLSRRSSNNTASGDYSSRHQKPSSAYVVSATGQLRQYAVPVTVSQVLETTNTQEYFSTQQQPPQQDDSSMFFLCNSDRLHFDDYIPSLHPHEELQPAQIYFLLPSSRLRQRLSASDMAALAVKASVALQQIDRRGSSGNRKARISPVFVTEEDRTQSSNHEINQLNMIKSSKKSGVISSSSSSSSSSSGPMSRIRSHNNKLSRLSSRRAKMAIRSFRLRLSTIHEGSMHRSSSSFNFEIQDVDQQFT